MRAKTIASLEDFPLAGGKLREMRFHHHRQRFVRRLNGAGMVSQRPSPPDECLKVGNAILGYCFTFKYELLGCDNPVFGKTPEREEFIGPGFFQRRDCRSPKAHI